MNYFYGSDALADAAPPLKWRAKTEREIAVHFPELPIVEVWHSPRFAGVSYDTARSWFDNGIITSDQWGAYQAIWRNSVPRLSGVAVEYEF